MKCANAYQHREHLFICPQSLTTDNLWIDEDPSAELEVTASAKEKGTALREALGLSRMGVPHPTQWNDRNKALLDAAGAKNWKAFTKEAISVCVELGSDGFVLMPYERSGRGSVEMPDSKLTLASAGSDEELGKALERALAVAR